MKYKNAAEKKRYIFSLVKKLRVPISIPPSIATKYYTIDIWKLEFFYNLRGYKTGNHLLNWTISLTWDKIKQIHLFKE